MYELKLRQVGNSEGLVLPKEILAKLHANRGDTIYAIGVPGGIKLTVYDEESVAQMRTAETVMRKRRTMLRALAKS